MKVKKNPKKKILNKKKEEPCNPKNKKNVFLAEFD